jgi:hypothetical protein
MSSTAATIRNDPRVQDLLSRVTRKGKGYYLSDGTKASVYEFIRNLGYKTSSSNLAVILARMQGRYVYKPYIKPKPPKIVLETSEATTVKNIVPDDERAAAEAKTR